MITAASNAVSGAASRKQTSATTTIAAAVMIAVGRSRAGAATVRGSDSSGRGPAGRDGAGRGGGRNGGDGRGRGDDGARDGARGTAPAALRERFGELGFLVDGLGLGERAEAFVLAAQIVAEVGFGPVGTFGPETRVVLPVIGAHASRSSSIGCSSVSSAKIAGTAPGGRLGPVRERRNLAARPVGRLGGRTSLRSSSRSRRRRGRRRSASSRGRRRCSPPPGRSGTARESAASKLVARRARRSIVRRRRRRATVETSRSSRPSRSSRRGRSASPSRPGSGRPRRASRSHDRIRSVPHVILPGARPG